MRTVAVLLGLLSAFPHATAAQAEFEPILSLQEYVDQLSSRTLALVGGNATYISHADGTVSGMVDGHRYSGAWRWDGTGVCFSGAVEGQNEISACADVSTNGEIARFSWRGWRTFDYRIDR